MIKIIYRRIWKHIPWWVFSKAWLNDDGILCQNFPNDGHGGWASADFVGAAFFDKKIPEI